MHERTYAFLVAMYEQVQGAIRIPEEGLRVDPRIASGRVGIALHSAEYPARLRELEDAGYIVPHPVEFLRKQDAFLITPEGIAAADEGGSPRP